MPYVSIMAFAAMLGITGAPFFNGSISKYFIEHGFAGSIVEYAVILINLGTMIYFIKFSQIFFKGKGEGKIETDIWKKVSMTVMGALCLITGMTGTIIVREVFHYDASLDFSGYLKNSLIFFATLGAGYLIYTKLLAKTDYVSNRYSLGPGVNGMGVGMAGFLFLSPQPYTSWYEDIICEGPWDWIDKKERVVARWHCIFSF
jgi:multicomponent Na+:H+ antiporter subunit D